MDWQTAFNFMAGLFVLAIGAWNALQQWQNRSLREDISELRIQDIAKIRDDMMTLERKNIDAHNRLSEAQQAHERHAFEIYARRDDIKEMREHFDGRFDRIEQSIAVLSERRHHDKGE